MDHEPLIDRLRALGNKPVDPATQSAHLSAMAGVTRRPRVGARAKVGAAFFAGLLVGGTGLASAGALPASVQDAAHTTLSQVGVSVPEGHGPPARSTVGCPSTGGPYKNHGEYVRSHHSDPNAGASQCGKPVQAGTDTPGVSEAPEAPEPTEAPEAPDSGDKGKPANPGANGKGHGKGKGHNGQGDNSQGDNGNAPTPAPNAAPLIPGPTSTTSTTKAPATTTTAPKTTTTTSH